MNRQSIYWRATQITLLGMTAFCCSNLEGQGTIESVSSVGEASVEIYNPDGSAYTNYLYRVVGHRTIEKFFFRTEAIVALNDYDMECGWNGEALHSIEYRPKELGIGLPPSARTNTLAARLEEGVAPRHGGIAEQLTALSLAPESKLRGALSNSPPIMLLWGEPFPESFSTYELKEDMETGRLISIKSFAPGFVAWQGKRRDLSPPYDECFLLWHFEVLEFQSGFPSKTRLRYFSPKDFEDPNYSLDPPANREDVHLGAQALLRLNFTPANPPEDFRPVIPRDPFYVEDYRYISELDVNEGLNPQEVGGVLIHKLKNKQWVYDTNRTDRAIVDIRRGLEARRRFVHSNLGRTLTLVLFILVISAPLAIQYRFQRRNQTKAQTTLKRNGGDESDE